MPRTTDTLLGQARRITRTIAAMLMGAVLRRRSVEEHEATLAALTPARRTAAITLIFALFFLLALAFGSFGWIGTLVFWLTVILLVK